MMHARKPNAMLIELVIVLLFFAISAGIILQLFAAAGDKSVQNATASEALFAAEDAAEQLLASQKPADAFFSDAGWQADGETYVTEIAGEGRTLYLRAAGQSEQQDAGTLESWTITVDDAGKVSITLPITRYLPGEVRP